MIKFRPLYIEWYSIMVLVDIINCCVMKACSLQKYNAYRRMWVWSQRGWIHEIKYSAIRHFRYMKCTWINWSSINSNWKLFRSRRYLTKCCQPFQRVNYLYQFIWTCEYLGVHYACSGFCCLLYYRLSSSCRKHLDTIWFNLALHILIYNFSSPALKCHVSHGYTCTFWSSARWTIYQPCAHQSIEVNG